MTAESAPIGARRLTAAELKRRLDAPEPLLLLDVRRGAALARSPLGIAGAVPILLDEAIVRIPDLPRETDILAYCLCSGQASSTRVARWLSQAGYRRVSVLEGGLPAWQAGGFPLRAVSLDGHRAIPRWIDVAALGKPATAASGTGLIAESAFLAGEKLPLRREMAVLFVDMVNSTELLFAHPPEHVLSLVQAFMEVVVDVAVEHCGDVHDFEGDGAMLYFGGPG